METATALVVGEALVDVVRCPDGAKDEHAGGSPANVAVGLARLGRNVDLLTSLGRDTYGEYLSGHLGQEQVGLLCAPRGDVRTSSATATIGPDGSASYEFDLQWDLAVPARLPHPLVVHTGSLGAILMPGHFAVVELLEWLRPAATLTYDINARPGVTGTGEEVLTRVVRIAELVDVVKASDEDLKALMPNRSPVAAATWLLHHGPTAVVVTLGSKGAVCVTREGVAAIDAAPTPVVDTIGAGDTFCAAMIERLWGLGLLGATRRPALRGLGHDTWIDVMRFAATAAAITVSRSGADLPRREDFSAEQLAWR